jgi:hypothetical protein
VKGAFLVSGDDRLFETVSGTLLSLGGKLFSQGAVAQLQDEAGGLFTTYPVRPELEWEFKSGELTAAPGASLPDVSDMTGIAIECRSEFQFAAIVKAIAIAGSTGDMWVVDGDGVVWPAAEVDASRVRL